MFTLEEYHKLKAAAFILHQKGLMQISPRSLLCYLTLLQSGKSSFALRSVAEWLNWPLERTRRSFTELASREWEGLPLIEVVKNNRSQGRFAPTLIQLVFRPTKFQATDAATDQATVGKSSPPNKISPSRIEPSRLNNCCCYKNKKQQTTPGVVGGDLETNHIATHQLVDKLKQVGVSDQAIRAMMAKYPPKIIQQQLNYLPYRQAKNPAGLLVQAIKGDWSTPKEYLAVKEQQRQTQEQNQLKDEQQRQLAQEAKQQEMRQKQLLTIEKQLSVTEKHALQKEAERQMRQRLGKGWPKSKPIPQTFLRNEFDSLLAQKYLLTKPQEKRPTILRPEVIQPR